MKFLILAAVIALSATGALARTRVLREADHEPGHPADPTAPHPGVETLLRKALGLLKKSADESLTQDIGDFENHLKNGDFKEIFEKVKAELKDQPVNIPTLLKSFKTHANESEYKDLINRVGKAAHDRLEKIRAHHDEHSDKIEKHIQGAVDILTSAIHPIATV